MKKSSLFRLSGALFSGLIMVLWLGACAEVKVSCPPAGGGGGGETGGCNPPVQYPGVADATTNFKDWVTRQPPPTGSMCSAPGSTRCNPASPGNCGFGKTCQN